MMGRDRSQGTMPDLENYVHRIGRTGRFGRKGVAINFYQTMEDMQNLEFLERNLVMRYAYLRMSMCLYLCLRIYVYVYLCIFVGI